MNLVGVSIVQIGQLVQNSPKVNGNGAKWKQLADRGETCKFLDGQALFTGLFDMYEATYKEMRNSLQPSSIEQGQEDVSQTEQNKLRKRDRNSEAECCTKTLKRPPPTYQNPRQVATNNFYAPLSHLHMENTETGSEGNSPETPGKNENPGKSRPPPIVLTSEANLVS
jgi:hypothetical protein